MSVTGILPPMITPFKAEGGVDYDAFVHNLNIWGKTGLSGLLVLGSNGESAYLNEEEKLRLIKLAVENSSGKQIMAGTGMETPRDTIALTNKAAELGANCALILPPNYYDSSMNDRVLIEFFTTVADNSDIPILIYNVPKYTHVTVSPDVIRTLAPHPNIIGMKDSSGNMPGFASFMRAAKGEDFSVLVGTASALYPALSLGASGGILALANCNPNECIEIYDLFKAGKLEESRDLYQRMFPVNACVTGPLGIAALKAACDMLGYQGGHVSRPLLDLTEAELASVRQVLVSAQLL